MPGCFAICMSVCLFVRLSVCLVVCMSDCLCVVKVQHKFHFNFNLDSAKILPLNKLLTFIVAIRLPRPRPRLPMYPHYHSSIIYSVPHPERVASSFDVYATETIQVAKVQKLRHILTTESCVELLSAKSHSV